VSLPQAEIIDVLPLFIRRDLGALSVKLQGTRNLTKTQKIEAMVATERLRADPDDPDAVAALLKILGI
jgi:hypothetical protein